LLIHMIVSVCLLPTVGQGELLPQQVAILANANSPDSLAVAQHYAKQRNIPTSHIIRLPLPDRDRLTREEYDRQVVLPLRLALEKQGLASTIRVLVTTYGIPLRIDAPTLSPEETRWSAEAQSYVKAARRGLEQWRLDLERMVPGASETEPPAGGAGQEILEMARTVALLSQADRRLRAAIEQRKDHPISQPDSQELLRLIRRYGGWGILLQRTRPTEEPSEVAVWRTLLERTSPLWGGLGRSPITTQRALIYRWAERLFGLRGVLELASSEVDLLTTTYADASLDSELSLLWWDRDLYPVAWRWSNPLFQDAAPTLEGLPILMVSRLDAPTAELAKGLVDKALQAEQGGWDGTVYFDARGLSPNNATDTYGVYDQSLRNAAEIVTRQSSYRVVLDNVDLTMASMSHVALYIGWYRLRAYDDVFSFNPGAIGYHMASAEAVTVHDRNERGWCKNALERGIAATLGSVGEPYLDAFPEPARFTALLLTGKYSLAEIYYLTSRYVSWRMVLFGDPLYNPMRGRVRSAPGFGNQFPMAPSERTMPEPIATLHRLKQEHASRRAQLNQLLLEAERTMKPTP
jgi:uncharacterized protein (TIGR03790 family)